MNKKLTDMARRIAELSDQVIGLQEEIVEGKIVLHGMMEESGEDSVGRCYWGAKANTAVYSKECQQRIDELQETIGVCKKQVSELKTDDKRAGTMISPAERMIYVRKLKK